MINIKELANNTKDLTLLYVEDDTEILKNTTELLSMFFKNIDTAENGQLGLDKYSSYYDNNDKYYDIVITDINMPELTGIEMSREILAINPMQDIIVMTAYNEVDFLSMAIELGVDGYLTKPLENDRLMSVLFKVSQKINDRKFVDLHIDSMEQLNIELSSQNDALEAKNKELEKSFRLLDTLVNKKRIIKSNIKKEELNEEEKDKEQFLQEQINEIINNDLEELKEILTEIDVNLIEIIDNVDEISDEKINVFSKLFSRYASILRYYNLFDDLGTAMQNFSMTIHTNPLPENKDSVKNILIILESFLFMLGKWQTDISSGDQYKQLKFDTSIISDINTISNMWTQKEEDEEAEADLDSVFDF